MDWDITLGDLWRVIRPVLYRSIFVVLAVVTIIITALVKWIG